MIMILISVIVSAVTTVVITAKVRKELMNYVDEMCQLNIDQTKQIKECAISSVKKMADILNQNKHG